MPADSSVKSNKINVQIIITMPHVRSFNPIRPGGGAVFRPPLGFFNLLATKIELDVSNSVTFPSTTKYMLC